MTALKQKHLLDDFQADGPSEDSNAAHLEQLKAVDRVFESASDADTPTEVRISVIYNNTFALFLGNIYLLRISVKLL